MASSAAISTKHPTITALAFGNLCDYALPEVEGGFTRLAHQLDAVMAASTDTGYAFHRWNWTLVDTQFVKPDLLIAYNRELFIRAQAALIVIGFVCETKPEFFDGEPTTELLFCRVNKADLGTDTLRLILPRRLDHPKADGLVVTAGIVPLRWQVAVVLSATDHPSALVECRPFLAAAKNDGDRVVNPDGGPGKLWLVLPSIPSTEAIPKELACPAPKKPHYLDGDSEEFRQQYYRGLFFRAGFVGESNLFRFLHRWTAGYQRFYRISHFVHVADGAFRSIAIRDVWRTSSYLKNGTGLLRQPVLTDPERVQSLFVPFRGGSIPLAAVDAADVALEAESCK